MYNYDEWSVPKLKKHYDELMCARENGKLGVVGHFMLQDVKYWLSLTPEQWKDYRTREEKAKKANQKRDEFRKKFELKGDTFIKHDKYIKPEDAGRIIGEYTPILQGEENPRYRVFPAGYADNFVKNAVPLVVTERLDPKLGYLDETVVFGDKMGLVSPDSIIEYENFAIGGKVKGFYMPSTVGMFKTFGTGKFSNSWYITSTIGNDVIRECLKQKGIS